MRTSILLLPLLLPLLAACNSTPEAAAGSTSTVPTAVPPLLGTVWVAIGIDGDPVLESPPVLRLAADGTVVGHGGVNRLTGSHGANDAGRLRLGPLATTRMAGPPERMALERAFTAALAGVDSYRFEDATLVLLTGETERVRLVAGDEDDLR